MSEGTRTPDRLDHNQELYQLSYAHRGASESTSARSVADSGLLVVSMGASSVEVGTKVDRVRGRDERPDRAAGYE